MKKLLSLFLALAMLPGVVSAPADALAEEAENGLPAVGDIVEGFEVREIREYGLIGAQLVLFEHQKTGAKMLYIANDDTNRAFQLTFPTRVTNDRGLPHVFEHATLSGSEKYPSAALWLNASMQAYNIDMNAYTTDTMTCYPIASLFEAQLLKLADFYTDSCLHPNILTDERIYRTEAWRYEMADADADLSYNGTVYSEMKDTVTLDSAALTAAKKATFPGASVSYQYGGDPDFIPEMTWEELKEYHDKYYHPSNCIAYLYGSFEDYTAFLKLLDEAFAPYEKAEFSFEEPDYARITEPVVSSFAYPAAAGTDTTNQTAIYYYILCPGMKGDIEQERLIDHACDLLNDPASPLMQTLEQTFPAGSFSLGRELAAPDDAIVFTASGLNDGDAELFRQTVDSALVDAARNGFAAELVDNTVTALKYNARLACEDSDPVTGIINNLACYYAASGNVFCYQENYEALNNIEAENSEGKLAGAVARWLVDPALYTLTTGSPVPGQLKVHDAELAAKLAEIKAGMSKEEIRAIVEATNAVPEEDDPSAMPADLTAVTAATLPEEVKEYDLRDETDENGLRRIEVVAGVDGISHISLYLDAAAMPQEDILYMQLFTHLLGSMDTDRHTWQELSPLITRYLYFNTFRISAIGWKNNYHPYAVTRWIALDEDLEAGYSLAEEIMFHTQFTDTETLLERITAEKDRVRGDISRSPYQIMLYRQLGITNPPDRFYSYISHLDYYTFLNQLEQAMQENPEEVVSRLAQVQQFLADRAGAVTTVAGNETSIALNRPLADAYYGKLENNPREPVSYELPAAAKKEGLILDANIQYNSVAVPWPDIAPEENGNEYTALFDLIRDQLLYPGLLDRAGAYDVFCSADDEMMYLITYRDPNVAETFAYFDSLPDLIDALTVDREMLENYIISTYSYLALSTGELTGAEELATNHFCGMPDDHRLQSMRSVKAATPDAMKKLAGYVADMLNTGVRGTAGSADAINANADMYDVILDPFNVEDAGITDVPEDHPNAAAIAAIMDAGAMTADGGAFRPGDPAALGDLAYAFYVLALGSVPPDADSAYQTFIQYGFLQDGGNVSDELTWDILNDQTKYFLNTGFGFDLTETFSGEGDVATRGELAGILYHIFLEK